MYNAEEFFSNLKMGMLSFLVVLCALIEVQGKAVPSRYKRNYEGSYHYIPYEEGIVQIPAGYSPENLPNYQDYVHGYVQTNGHDWSSYYQPMIPHPIQHPYSNINEHPKMKAKHTWHFIHQSHDPLAHFTDGMNHLDSGVEAPNVVEALVKKEIIDRHDEYDVPIVVEAIIRKDLDHVDPEIPVDVDSLAVEEKSINSKYDGNALVTKQSAYYMYEPIKEKPIKDVAFISTDEFELPVVVDSFSKKKLVKLDPVSYDAFELPVVVDSLKKDKPIKIEPVSLYGALELPVVDSLTKKDKVEAAYSYDMEKPIKEKPIKEKPIKEKPIKEKPIKEKPIKEKPIKEKPIVSYEAVDNPLEFDSLNKVEEHEPETPVVIEALVRKETPTSHTQDEHDSPIVVEALLRKPNPIYERKNTNAKKDEIRRKDLLHSVESILNKEEVENFAVPIGETLTFEQNVDGNEPTKWEGIAFNEPEMDSFEDGSAMDFDRSRLARSFLPVGSNIFSIATNVKEQERRKFKNCVTLKNETGNCMPFQLCSVSSAVNNIDELLRNACIIDEVFVGVCCPEFPVETVRVDWEQLKPDVEKLNEEKSPISEECGRLPLIVTDQDPWPWMASLIAKSSDKIFCGGALITEQYVLTAAHCTKRIPRNQIMVRLGRPASENRPEPDFEVVEIKRHAGYNPRTMQNDIALLKLSRRVQLGDFRRVICLAKGDEDIEGLVSESASLLRWKETPGEIKDVESLAVISTQECQNRMRTAIADSILCTEPRTDETNCNTDSGAPLIISKDDKFEVIGILTWNRNDCDERFPAVFARVSSYHRWIEKLAS